MSTDRDGAFDDLLDAIDQEFQGNPSQFDTDTWPEVARKFLSWLRADTLWLFPTVTAVLGPRILEGHKFEMTYPLRPMIEVGTIRYRPTNAYYEREGRVLPMPDNPTGPSATGLELAIRLYAGFKAQRPLPSQVVVRFEVWGAEERSAFREMFRDHKHVVSTLIDSVHPEFWTACVFNRVAKLRGRLVSPKVDLYLDEDDDESEFRLEVAAKTGAEPAAVVRAVLVFAALYDGVYQYLIPKGQRARILEHFQRLHLA